jgi:hypothetical protein
MKTPSTIVQVCIIAATAAALSLGVATAQRSSESKSSTLSEKDKAFMKKAARGGMMEVAMGKLAEQNAQNEDSLKSPTCSCVSIVGSIIVNADHRVMRPAKKLVSKAFFSCQIYSRSPL